MAATSVPKPRRDRQTPHGRDRANSKINTRVGGRRAAGPEAGGRKRRPAGPAGPGLGNNAKSAATAGQSPTEKRQASRSEKYDARRKLSEITSLRRVSKCGRVSMADEGEVHLRHAPGPEEGTCGTAGLGGLVTCGSIWVCPVCSARISAERALELSRLIEWNAERGGTVGLLTLTMSHHNGHRLKALRRGLTGAWRHVTGSRGWKDAKKDLGMDYVRAIEATHGDNGWHLHIHVLLVFEGQLSPDMVEVLGDEVWTRWETGLTRQGFTASREHGVDVRMGEYALERVAGYINKLAFEAAGGRFKKSHQGGRTPFEILAEGLATGNADDLDLWFEWEQGSRGMRQLVWSRGLKDRAGITERDDEEIAAQVEEGSTIAVLPARTWKQVYPVADELLTVTELGGPDAAYAWLDARDLVFEVPERSDPDSDPPDTSPPP